MLKNMRYKKIVVIIIIMVMIGVNLPDNNYISLEIDKNYKLWFNH